MTSQNKAGGVSDLINLDVHSITELQKLGIKPTNDGPKYNYKVQSSDKYSEYAFSSCTATVVALRKEKEFVNEVKSGDEVGVILDQTNFYAEQGGQIFDEGFLVKVDDEVSNICEQINTKLVMSDLIIHFRVLKSELKTSKSKEDTFCTLVQSARAR